MIISRGITVASCSGPDMSWDGIIPMLSTESLEIRGSTAMNRRVVSSLYIERYRWLPLLSIALISEWGLLYGTFTTVGYTRWTTIWKVS